MAHIQQVGINDFEHIYPLLQTFHNTQLDKNVWKNIFSYPWHSKESYRGYALIDNTALVGFLGTVFAKRSINGKAVTTCNLTSWVVQEAYRSDSLQLLSPLLQQPAYVLLNLTCSPRVCEISQALGFQILEQHAYMLFPLLCPSVKGNQRWRITQCDTALHPECSDIDKTIFADHKSLPCRHIVVHTDEGYCYVVFTRVKRYKKLLTVNYIHYIGNPVLFQQYLKPIVSHIMQMSPGFCVMVDVRTTHHADISRAFKYKLSTTRIYKATCVEDVPHDNLYTEMVLLGL